MLIDIFFVIPLAVLILAFSYLDYRREKTPLSPFIILSAIVFLVQVYAPIDWYIRDVNDWYGIPAWKGFARATILIFFAYLAFAIAYNYFVRNKRASYDVMNYSKSTNELFIVACIVFLASFMIYILYLTIRGRSLISQITLGQIGGYSIDSMLAMQSTGGSMWFLKHSLDLLVGSIIVMTAISRNKLSIACVCLVFLITVASGWRYLVVTLLISLLVIFLSRSKKKLGVTKFAAIAFSIAILVGLVGELRGIFRGVDTPTEIESVNIHQGFMTNIEIFHAYTLATTTYDNIADYYWGRSYLGIPIMFVPSYFYPGKPPPAVVEIMKEMYGPLASSGPAMPLWGEFYVNFGGVGMILSFMILGIGLAKIANLVKQRDVSIYSLVVYSITCGYLSQLLTRGNAPQIAVEYFFLMLPTMLIYVFAKTKKN